MRPTAAILDAIARASAEGRVVEHGKPAPISPTDESEFQSLVVAEAKTRGWKVYHTFDSRRSEPGFPDLIMIRGRRKIAAELKMSGNKPTAAQLDWLSAFHRAGDEIAVWYPHQWAEIVEALA